MQFDIVGKAVRVLKLPTVNYDNHTIKVVPAQVGDVNSRFFEVHLYDDRGEIPFSQYNELYLGVTLPDDNVEYSVGEIDGDIGYVKLLSSMLQEAGRLKCSVMLRGQDDNNEEVWLTSQTFYVTVLSSSVFDESQAGNDDDYNLLLGLIKDVENLEENIETAEAARVAAENKRGEAENGRVSAENQRVENENERIANENTRNSNEETRESNETARQNAETGRVNAEKNRVSAETARESAEDERERAEADREDAEADRVAAETGRVNAERGRVTAEQGRVTAEQGRVTAENNRVTEFNEKIQECEDATAAAQEVVDEAQTLGITGTVKFDRAQDLTDTQETQARNNIGAAPLASPTFTGTPRAPSPTTTDDSTRIATTAYVRDVIPTIKVNNATQADKDGEGNVISETYAKKSEVTGGASTNVFKTTYSLQTAVGANTGIDDGMISPSASLIKKGDIVVDPNNTVGLFQADYDDTGIQTVKTVCSATNTGGGTRIFYTDSDLRALNLGAITHVGINYNAFPNDPPKAGDYVKDPYGVFAVLKTDYEVDTDVGQVAVVATVSEDGGGSPVSSTFAVSATGCLTNAAISSFTVGDLLVINVEGVVDANSSTQPILTWMGSDRQHITTVATYNGIWVSNAIGTNIPITATVNSGGQTVTSQNLWGYRGYRIGGTLSIPLLSAANAVALTEERLNTPGAEGKAGGLNFIAKIKASNN